MRLGPEKSELIRSECSFPWNDGGATFLPLRLMRGACPCAACGGEPDVMCKLVRPKVHYTPQRFDLSGWQLVGGYALQPTWGDRHSSGIYSYQYLRRLDPARAA